MLAMSSKPRSSTLAQELQARTGSKAVFVAISQLRYSNDNDGNVIVKKAARITARHIKQLEKAISPVLEVPTRYLYGRVLAKT